MPRVSVKTRIFEEFKPLPGALANYKTLIYSQLEIRAKPNEMECELHHCSTFSNWAMERLSKG